MDSTTVQKNMFDILSDSKNYQQVDDFTNCVYLHESKDGRVNLSTFNFPDGKYKVSILNREGAQTKNGDRISPGNLPIYLDSQNIEIKNTSSSFDCSDKLRFIVKEKIRYGTVMMKIYNATCEYILNSADSGIWIDRSLVTHALVKDMIGNRPTVEARLKDIYQNKYTMNISSVESGLFMRKKNGIVRLKIE